MRLLVQSRKEEERALALLARSVLRTETRRGGRNASGGSFPAARGDVGIPIAALNKSRGFHGSASRWLVEDRDGRGLTEEIIEENLVRFSLAFCFLSARFLVLLCGNINIRVLNTFSLLSLSNRTESEAPR